MMAARYRRSAFAPYTAAYDAGGFKVGSVRNNVGNSGTALFVAALSV